MTLLGLSSAGEIMWSESKIRKRTIFPQIPALANLMKSLFHHNMLPILKIFAQNAKCQMPDWSLEFSTLAENYYQGLFLENFILAMFELHTSQMDTSDFKITRDYSSLSFPSSDENSPLRKASLAFLGSLEDVKFASPAGSEDGHRWFKITYLVKQEATALTGDVWDTAQSWEKQQIGVAIDIDVGGGCMSDGCYAMCLMSVYNVMSNYADITKYTRHTTSSWARGQVVDTNQYTCLVQLC